MPTPTGHTRAIRASRAIGTDIYNAKHEKIGELEDIMLDKMDNTVMFAVVSFGGFLGIGEKYHAIPWSSLDYEKSVHGYIVPYTKEQLEKGPVSALHDLTKDDGMAARDASFNYYGVQPYWS